MHVLDYARLKNKFVDFLLLIRTTMESYYFD